MSSWAEATGLGPERPELETHFLAFEGKLLWPPTAHKATLPHDRSIPSSCLLSAFCQPGNGLRLAELASEMLL